MRVFEASHPNREANAPRDQQKAGDRRQNAGTAAQLVTDTNRNPNDIRSRQELGEADDVEELRLAEPAAALDRDPARPDVRGRIRPPHNRGRGSCMVRTPRPFRRCVAAIRQRFSAVAPFLNERGRRVVAAAEASAAGYGGIAAVTAATGLAASTIGRGLRELSAPEESGRIRRRGGGRKTAVAQDATLLSDLGALVEPTCRGDPQSPLRWTCKSVRRLAEELQAQGHRVGRTLVSTLLDSMGYSLQGNRKTREGDSHPDRNAQFEYINGAVGAALAERQR